MNNKDQRDEIMKLNLCGWICRESWSKNMSKR